MDESDTGDASSADDPDDGGDTERARPAKRVAPTFVAATATAMMLLTPSTVPRLSGPWERVAGPPSPRRWSLRDAHLPRLRLFCRAERHNAHKRRATGGGGRQTTYAMSFSFLSGRTFTEVLAGLAFTSIVSPGRNGFGTFFRALCAGFFTTVIFIRPGIVQAPTAPFWTWRSMTESSASKTSATCRLVRSVFSAISENICVFVIASVSLVTLANIPLRR